jgi:hypothetical protein
MLRELFSRIRYNTPQKRGFKPLNWAQKMTEGVFQHAGVFSEVGR